jgi:hypothetical protein
LRGLTGRRPSGHRPGKDHKRQGAALGAAHSPKGSWSPVWILETHRTLEKDDIAFPFDPTNSAPYGCIRLDNDQAQVFVLDRINRVALHSGAILGMVLCRYGALVALIHGMRL